MIECNNYFTESGENGRPYLRLAVNISDIWRVLLESMTI